MRSKGLSLFSLVFIAIVLPGCGKKIELKGVRAARATVESSVTTTSAGTVIADQQAVLGFGTTGRVARILVRAGDLAKKGQLLAELENRELKAIAGDTSRELKRTHELFDAGLVSRAALDEAVKNDEVARANLDRSIIRAPFDGIVTEMNLEVGELAQSPSAPAGKAPVRIVDMKPRLIRGDIDEIDLSKVRVGTPARIRVPAVGKEWINAEVRRVVPFVSTAKEQDRTSEIELKVVGPARAQLPVGASAEIEIITDRKENVLAVPTRVILGKTGLRHVFRHVNGKVEEIPVKTGVGNYDRTEILSGIQEGDTVVYPPEETELKTGLRATVNLQPWP